MADSKKLEFGDYIYIEQKRFGVPNEQYLYKVIGTLRSNAWVDVPVMAINNKSVIHHDIDTLDGLEDIVRCVCCGVCEEEVQRFRAIDVVKRPAAINKINPYKSAMDNHMKYLHYRLHHLNCDQVVQSMDQVKRSAKIREVRKMINRFELLESQIKTIG